MSGENGGSGASKLPQWASIILDLPWVKIAGEIWKIGRKALRGLANEGIYEVLDYETNLELHDSKGGKAKMVFLRPISFHHIVE
jgi:hypothetical protein